MSNISYSLNNTSLKLANIFSQSSDGLTLTSINKTAFKNNSAYLAVTAQITASPKTTFTNTINLYFDPNLMIVPDSNPTSTSLNL